MWCIAKTPLSLLSFGTVRLSLRSSHGSQGIPKNRWSSQTLFPRWPCWDPKRTKGKNGRSDWIPWIWTCCGTARSNPSHRYRYDASKDDFDRSAWSRRLRLQCGQRLDVCPSVLYPPRKIDWAGSLLVSFLQRSGRRLFDIHRSILPKERALHPKRNFCPPNDWTGTSRSAAKNESLAATTRWQEKIGRLSQ